MYLQRRNGHYWFRKATPLDLVHMLGQAEIRCSLRTTRRDVAKRRAGQLLVALENVFAVLRSERPLGPTKVLMAELARDALQKGSSLEINPLAWRLQKAVDALGSASVPPPADGTKTLVAIGDIDALLVRERPHAEANRIAAELLGLALRIRRGNNWVRSEPARMLVSLCERLAALSEQAPADTPNDLEAIRAIIREEVCRAGLGVTMAPASPVDAASLREIVATEVRAGVASAGRDRWSTEPLSKMIEKFLEAQYPSEEGKSKVGTKHRADVERRLAAFLAFTGDLAVRDISRDHLKAYRDVLDHLPDRFEARFKTKDMRLAIERNAQRKVPYPVIGPTTINLKWLGPVDRLFDWLVTEEKIEKTPVAGIRSDQEVTEAANTKRLPFKPDQISKLFAVTSAASPRTALYWLPFVMLMTGARPNELAQLRTDDLVTYNGRPHLNVLCVLDDDDEAADTVEKTESKDDPRRVKTFAGRRMLPLHPLLIQAGFIEFIEWRHKGHAKQLFRELRADQHGFWSSAITKRLNRIIRGKLGITNPRYSAYSLRHNFIDACRSANIPEETRMKIVGHQLEGVHGGYGNPWVLPDESALIDTVRFDGIDFADYPVQQISKAGPIELERQLQQDPGR